MAPRQGPNSLPAQSYLDILAYVMEANADGELINWTIVESREGLAKVREIAAVPGIGVLWPGAGTLRRVFSSTNDAGERVYDAEAWEAAIQDVLAACKSYLASRATAARASASTGRSGSASFHAVRNFCQASKASSLRPVSS